MGKLKVFLSSLSTARPAGFIKAHELGECTYGFPNSEDFKRPARSIFRNAAEIGIAFVKYSVVFALGAVLAMVYLRSVQQVDRAWTMSADASETITNSPASQFAPYDTERIISRSFKPNLTDYQGLPTDKANALWHDLYNPIGHTKIPIADAPKYNNHVLAIPGDDEHVGVFMNFAHDLHCLNMVRQYVYATTYDLEHEEMVNLPHVDHCIDQLRQRLQCMPDLAPMPWVWHAPSGHMTIWDAPSKCRDWDALHAWASARGTNNVEPSIRPAVAEYPQEFWKLE